jgi:uncharacterized membrane protein YfcA
MGPFTPGEYFWLIGLGVMVGFLGTLIGAGGAFLLMPLPGAGPGVCGNTHLDHILQTLE